MTVKLYAGTGGMGAVLAELEESGTPQDSPCWTSSMSNDDETKTVFLISQFEGAARHREFHGAGTFDLPASQPVTMVSIRDRARHDDEWHR